MKTWRYFLLPGALLAVIPTALGQPHTCSTADSDSTSVKRVAIENDDLVVDVLWSSKIPSGTMGTIQVLDRVDRIAVSSTVQAEPGRIVSHPMTVGPAFFVEYGYWFSVRVVALGDSFPTSDFPFLASPCSLAEGCDYSVVEGIGADTVTMDAELSGLLDALEASGSQDLLNDALRARPDLQLQIYWVADQIARLQAGTDTSDCVCLWNASFDLNPASQGSSTDSGPIELAQTNPDWEMMLIQGPGANFYLAGQILGGASQTRSATVGARAGLHLRCWSTLSGDGVGPGGSEGTPIGVAAGRATVAEASSGYLPKLVPCDLPCADAEIDVTASARSQVAANAWSTAHHGAKSVAFAAAELFLDEQSGPAFTALATVTADRPPGDPAQDPLQDSPDASSGQWLVPGSDASATFVSQGLVEVCLAAYGSAMDCPASFSESTGDNGPWAYGCAVATSTARLVGEASCALEPRREVSLWQVDIANTQDGLVIVPWNP
ncbi:MAG: hypothetical protein GY719_09790 [bacterium]|nr:hypothetical protein [bacterium]